ncbi:DUF3710 domain-containing protein [Angustibacter sp. McL0619]|uniref:DUF3710 domain-containing protein n=1 Tax=Angustibacter sp. McL0619 TaxID=3415676 RepID=UPI003CE770CF
MSLFKRRKDADTDEVEGADATLEQAADGDADDGDGVEPDAAAQSSAERAATFDRSGGPLDRSEVEDLEGRLDIGALWLPMIEGIELQLQMDEATQQVTGAFIVLKDAAVQVQAFAAPRSEGIWAEVCTEIAAGITEQGGTADPGYGRFGRELVARVPTQQPDGKVGFQPLRFTGVDGPRWLLRAVFHGRAAVEPEAEASAALEALVAGIVVDRGIEPMGPRELLPLRLPVVGEQLAEGADGEDGPARDAPNPESIAANEPPASFDDLQPFRRGPEITEQR